MSTQTPSNSYQIFNDDSLNILNYIPKNSVDCIVTDPPYGISYQAHEWDKSLPDKQIWQNAFEAIKPGGFGLVFSSVRLMHRMMVDLEDSGFLIKDVLFWVYLNGMPKSRNISINIDKELGVESKIVGEYKYKQGYVKGGADSYLQENTKFIQEPASQLGQKYQGCGLNLKPAYEPIILIQKPIEKSLSVAQNIIKYGTGVLNIEDCRIPYERGESKVGHNPHPKGRIPGNIIRTEDFEDGYDKFFTVAKVRQNKNDFNFHPTLKPIELMEYCIKLVSFEGMNTLDMFAGSGSTGVACQNLNRSFVGFELEKQYFDIIQKRLNIKEKGLF